MASGPRLRTVDHSPYLVDLAIGSSPPTTTGLLITLPCRRQASPPSVIVRKSLNHPSTMTAPSLLPVASTTTIFHTPLLLLTAVENHRSSPSPRRCLLPCFRSAPAACTSALRPPWPLRSSFARAPSLLPPIAVEPIAVPPSSPPVAGWIAARPLQQTSCQPRPPSSDHRLSITDIAQCHHPPQCEMQPTAIRPLSHHQSGCTATLRRSEMPSESRCPPPKRVTDHCHHHPSSLSIAKPLYHSRRCRGPSSLFHPDRAIATKLPNYWPSSLSNGNVNASTIIIVSSSMP